MACHGLNSRQHIILYIYTLVYILMVAKSSCILCKYSSVVAGSFAGLFPAAYKTANLMVIPEKTQTA